MIINIKHVTKPSQIEIPLDFILSDQIKKFDEDTIYNSPFFTIICPPDSYNETRDMAIKLIGKYSFIDVQVHTVEFGFQVYNPYDKLLTPFDGRMYQFCEKAVPHLLNLNYHDLIKRRKPALVSMNQNITREERESLIEITNAYPSLDVVIPGKRTLKIIEELCKVENSSYIVIWPYLGIYSTFNFDDFEEKMEKIRRNKSILEPEDNTIEMESNDTNSSDSSSSEISISENSSSYSEDSSESTSFSSESPYSDNENMISSSSMSFSETISERSSEQSSDTSKSDKSIYGSSDSSISYSNPEFETENSSNHSSFDPDNTISEEPSSIYISEDYSSRYSSEYTSTTPDFDYGEYDLTKAPNSAIDKFGHYSLSYSGLEFDPYFDYTFLKGLFKFFFSEGSTKYEEDLDLFSDIIAYYSNHSFDCHQFPWDIFYGKDRNGEEYAHLFEFMKEYKNHSTSTPTFSPSYADIDFHEDYKDNDNYFNYMDDFYSSYDIPYYRRDMRTYFSGSRDSWYHESSNKGEERFIFDKYAKSNQTKDQEYPITFNWFDEYMTNKTYFDPYTETDFDEFYFISRHDSYYRNPYFSKGPRYGQTKKTRNITGIFQLIGYSARGGMKKSWFDVIVPKFVENMASKGRFWRDFGWAVNNKRYSLPWDEFGPGMSKYRELVYDYSKVTNDARSISYYSTEDIFFSGGPMRETREKISYFVQNKLSAKDKDFISHKSEMISKWISRLTIGCEWSKITSPKVHTKGEIVHELNAEEYETLFNCTSDLAILYYDSSKESYEMRKSFYQVANECRCLSNYNDLKFYAINIDFNSIEFTHPNMSAPLITRNPIPFVIVLPQVWYLFRPFYFNNKESLDGFMRAYTSRTIYRHPGDAASELFNNFTYQNQIVERLYNFSDKSTCVSSPSGRRIMHNDMFYWSPRYFRKHI
ncbi:hypothetical protein TVAG_392510 [Trichomonas vaginalis G3]|uniref:Uncharacterized protein n=1 Tax=Trichomonas vaginalis (strain ATCC PRA-98 / G3) TaxID=412133 RepID=A2DWV2_TRIV3|nr:hypothetical protein TVAGG3_0839360 [Trichomonas vaginalis G3]EAY15134.1 hypothetical protein TVAG_392510 [Trichomonas vaginalis G3]KAI5499174.1 hypothetical protein TVAGG3_0839360 [Trichomonas vaginalis G3]|eukprot:XP_001327357.1 hypothetical protein [Trichomonas vaginalis G3]